MTPSREGRPRPYPPNLQRQAEQITALWSCNDLTRVFPSSHAKVMLPWPRASRLPDKQLYDQHLLHAEFAEPLPAVDLVDPRTLWSSQPAILRAGVEYYLGPAWFRTGTTYADRYKPFNHLPVIERRTDGRDVILGGHHRSCAALLRGEPVLARVVVHPGREHGERVDLRLPSLAVGPWSAATTALTSDDAVTAIRYGERVAVPDHDVADRCVDGLAQATSAEP